MQHDHLRVSQPTDLRWKCDLSHFDFQTTAEIQCTSSVLGQDTAQEAIEFGIECLSPGQNIYVRGARGTGRIRMVRQLLKKLQPTTNDLKDYCYVFNFDRPDRPRLITLPAGQAPAFRKSLLELAEYANEGLRKSLDSEPFAGQREALSDQLQQKVTALTKPLESAIAAAGLVLVSPDPNSSAAAMILPVLEGQPISPAKLQLLISQEQAPAEILENYQNALPDLQKQQHEVTREVNELYRATAIEIRDHIQQAARQLLSTYVNRLEQSFGTPEVLDHIEQIVSDIVDNRLHVENDEPADLKELYGVNIVLTHTDKTSRPVVEECTPNLMNLLGTVEPEFLGDGRASSDYRGVRAGALLRADQGYLILDVNDLVAEPGAYRSLMRTLRTGQLEIVPPEMGMLRQQIVTQPEPIQIQVRVILIGDAQTYYQLDYSDPDFRELFKVLADFDNELDRNKNGLTQYASVVAQLCQDESLKPMSREAIAALAEHGARIVARPGKLTARLGRIADIAREAAFLAAGDVVQATDIKQAVGRTKARASLPSRKFQSMVESKTIILKTSGQTVGQVNGLAVMQSGQLTYGFPARITTTISPGSAGLINIEGQASMSGSIHTKGFQILGGLLRHLISPDHPLAFSASIAFEQSYGGIDGDSASGAEMVCLLSALTGVPVKQTMAMTGAIDQHGHIEAIGGVNEKIEGFFDACEYFGLTGDQGVIIPRANAGDLMLREDVVQQCVANQFHIYAVERIEEAIELMMGVPAGRVGSEGQYAEGSVLNLAVKKARDYWRLSLSSPAKLAEVINTAQSPRTDRSV